MLERRLGRLSVGSDRGVRRPKKREGPGGYPHDTARTRGQAPQDRVWNYPEAVSRWKLTVRHGSDVDHASFDDLDQAVAAMRERALAIRAEGPVEKTGGFKDYEPRDQVHARLQLTGRGLVKRPVAGVDVRGNGEFVPYRGGIRREELDPSNHDTPFDLVRETLG